jgi:hypothetical protein
MVINTKIISESRNTLVLLLVVLASARASSRAVCLPPETGDLHTLVAINIDFVVIERLADTFCRKNCCPLCYDVYQCIVVEEYKGHVICYSFEIIY